MKQSYKDFITNTIQERDKAVQQTLLRLWRLGHIKKPNRPKTLIIFPTKDKKTYIPYTRDVCPTILGVFREREGRMDTIYLSPEYTNVTFI
jgi:hypothetical protein